MSFTNSLSENNVAKWPDPQSESWRKAPIFNFDLNKIFVNVDISQPANEINLELKSLYKQFVGKHLARFLTPSDNQEQHTEHANSQIIFSCNGYHFTSDQRTQKIVTKNVFTMPDSMQPWIENDIFTSINANKNSNPLVLDLSNQKETKNEIIIVHILFDNEPLLVPKTQIFCPPESQNSITEIFWTPLFDLASQENGTSSANTAEYKGMISHTDIICAENSLTHYHAIQSLPENTIAIQYLNNFLKAKANCKTGLYQIGSRFNKYFASTFLEGQESQSEFYALAIARKNQYLDFDAKMVHLGKHTRSNLISKSAISGRSFFNFSGLLRMEKQAAFSNAQQVNKNLALSKKAHVHTAPKLEILVDEVSCSHGATVSEVDQDTIFYLTSRGIDPQKAKQIIVSGFLKDVSDRNHSLLARNITQEIMTNALKDTHIID